MPNRQVGESKDEYIGRLENEVIYYSDQVIVLKRELRELAVWGPGRRSSKADLRKHYSLSEDDVLFSDQVMEFAQQYLFPRFKFPDKGWMNHDPSKKKSFSAFVKCHLQLRPGKQFAKEWDTIIAPAIVKKYTVMRCNINNDVHRTFMGK